MNKKKSRIEQEAISDAAEQAVEAAFNFGRALIRNALKKRTHRNPDEQKIENYLASWLVHGDFKKMANKIALKCLRDWESWLGKTSKELTSEEQRDGYKYVAIYFQQLSVQVSPPRGRIQKKVKGGGIINNAISLSGVEKELRQKKKIERAEFETTLLAHRDGIRARKEKKLFQEDGFSEEEINQKIGSLTFWREYEDKMDRDERPRLPRGELQRLFDHYGIDPRNRAAMKMRLSRRNRRNS